MKIGILGYSVVNRTVSLKKFVRINGTLMAIAHYRIIVMFIFTSAEKISMINILEQIKESKTSFTIEERYVDI